ncbi:Maf family protein [Bifidobacterium mongoliense]|uniref:Maf family protein n=1 Tax=Bifidobacterium mongoliense TaxID=518643 RepID=UPI00264A3AF5|nr:Maf family protein [Bifidobacterium mongoliense]MDN5979478.1 Maf family protein [Bifidobacterium mongoliense]
MSIQVVLASQSVSRRNVLTTAGVCPIIRVSHVDEPAALAAHADRQGVTVDKLDTSQRVTVLARAKAQAVYEAYRDVARTAGEARGEQVTARPLDAETSRSAKADGHAAPAAERRFVRMSTTTRAFAEAHLPMSIEPLSGSASTSNGLGHGEVGPLIIGCDSMFCLDGVSYGKPHNPDTARQRLRAMRSRTGELWTGHCVIDFATGRQVAGTSHARVTFGDYSDRDIERYIATGEPLEVAGSFTLEGFGAAFIDGVEGDPHGVMGVSLPLLRRLAGQLGVEWTDLWNVTPHATEPVGKREAKMQTPPRENVHQPGDGWVECACGRRPWGGNGAAGVLLARRAETTGRLGDVVMQHRAIWSAEGGTWGIPGGAIADGESPIEGALRESFEEANITARDIEVVGAYREDHGPWAYTTVIAFEKPGHHVAPRANDDESLEIAWVPMDEVPHRRLLTAMRADWPRFAVRLEELAASVPPHHSRG